VLELRNVTAGYDGHIVLRDVDLVVPDDTVVALLGPNGAGKTTLLRVASGLLPPSSGQVVLDGVDVTSWPSDRLARAGLCHVPEGRGVFAGLTVENNLRLLAPPERERLATTIAADVFPRLGERLAQRAGTMSGGEQQMLALAHAYVAESRTVLLDEVSMGLAPKIIDEIFGYLRRLGESGAALLLVEQYVHRALELADFVYILNRGRIEFAGEPAELADDTILASYLGEVA
jgi:branched-chain amino acid transport system ATP-binding protein